MAFHFHWPLAEILDLEHPLRRAFVGQIDMICARQAAAIEYGDRDGDTAGAPAGRW